MSTIIRPEDRYPEPYEPAEPQFSLGDRLAGRFGLARRVRRRFAAAFQFPRDLGRKDALARAVAKLQGTARRGPAGETLIAEVLCYLAWRALEEGDPQEAARRVAELDGHSAPVPARVSLRWRLMELLAESGPAEAHIEQAKAFLADPLVNRAAHGTAVLLTVRRLYKEASPAVCAAALDGANEHLARARQLIVARQLCECPATFDSEADAQAWSERLDPQRLRFSRSMAADALLVQVRAAEWARDWDRMVLLAKRARRVSRNSPPARYWLARAKLRLPMGDPGEHLGKHPLPDSPERARLLALVDAHKQPRLECAEALLAILTGEQGELAVQELDLAAELLRRCVEADPASTPELIEQRAALCTALEEGVGPHPWAAVHVARKDILLDQHYEAAFARLERTGGPLAGTARELARVARLLAASPAPLPDREPDEPEPASREPEPDEHEASDEEADAADAEQAAEDDAGEQDPDDVLTTLETAMHRVLGNPEQTLPLADAALRLRLGQAGGHSLFERFPALKPVADAVAFALRAVGGETDGLREELLAREAPTGGPPWVAWLWVRTVLLACDPRDPAPSLAAIDLAQPAAAWLVEGWACNESRARATPPEPLAAAASTLDASIESLPEPAASCLAWVRGARAHGYRLVDGPGDGSALDAPFPGLSGLCRAAAAAEAAIEMGYACGRAALAAGEAEEAASQLAKLGEELAGLCAISTSWWAPLVRYWLGVALARADKGTAVTELRALLDGPRDLEARAQLALLAIRWKRLDEAHNWLDPLAADVPGVRYAKALLHAREGDDERVRELLESPEAGGVLEGSSYALAAQRLLAALDERRGCWAQAEQAHRRILEASPDDAITCTRLLRLRVRAACREGAPTRAALGEEADALLATGASAVAWCRPYRLLYRVAAGLGDDGDGDLERAGQTGGAAWRQLLVRRLLQQRRPDDAARALDEAADDALPWQERTRQILLAHEALAGLWQPYEPPSREAIEERAAELCPEEDRSAEIDEQVLRTAEVLLRAEAPEPTVSPSAIDAARSCLDQIDPLEPDADDRELSRWQRLLRLALEAAAADPETAPALTRADVAPAGDAWPFWSVFDLWSADAQARRRAAETVTTALRDDPAAWPPAPRDLLSAMAAHILGDDDAYLDSYDRLLPRLESLAADGQELWLGAARIWFKRRDWPRLAEGERPACVRDLSHPGARLAVALACARAAADADAADPADAAALVRQASETLAPLLPHAGADVDERLRLLADALEAANDPHHLARAALGINEHGWTQRPYADEAIEAWTELLQNDPENLEALHHLAIMHHARAIDLEQGPDPAAADADWHKALSHWHDLCQHDAFWERLAAQIHEPHRRDEILDELKTRWPQQLLQLHYDIAFDPQTDPQQRSAYHICLALDSPFPAEAKERVRRHTYERHVDSLDPRLWQDDTLEPRILEAGTNAIAGCLEVDPGCLAALADLVRLTARQQAAWLEQLQPLSEDDPQRDDVSRQIRQAMTKWQPYWKGLLDAADILEPDQRYSLCFLYRTLGEAHIAMGRYDEAARLLQDAERVAEDEGRRRRVAERTGEALALDARSHADSIDPAEEQRAKALCEFVRQRPDLSLAARRSLADAYVLIRDFDAAEDTCRAGLGMEPAGPGVDAAQVAERNRQGLRELLERSARGRRRVEVRKLLTEAGSVVAEGQHEKACEILGRALGVDPHLDAAYYLRCQCHLALLRPAEAQADLDTFRQLQDKSEGPQATEATERLANECARIASEVGQFGTEGVRLRQQAELALRNDDLDQAQALLHQAIARTPAAAQHGLRAQLATLLTDRVGQTVNKALAEGAAAAKERHAACSQALGWAQEAADLDPGSLTIKEELQRLQQLVVALEDASEREADYGGLRAVEFQQQAVHAFNQGDFDEAIVLLRQAIAVSLRPRKLEGELSQVLTASALARLDVEQPLHPDLTIGQARELLDEALRLDAANEKARETRERLDQTARA